MSLERLTQGERIVLFAGALLLLDLLFFPWHKLGGVAGATLKSLGADITLTAVEQPNAALGWLAVLAAGAMVAQVVLNKLTKVELPRPPRPWGQLHFLAGVAVAVLLVLKLLSETSALGWGAWLGLALGGVVAYGGHAIRKETLGHPA